MKLLNSRKNGNRLRRQLLAVLFTLGMAGSPFGQTAAAVDLSPGCQKEFEELGKTCATAMATNDGSAQTGVAAATQSGPCQPGMTFVPSRNSQDNPKCVPSVNTSAGQQQTSATIAKTANTNISATCAETLKHCEEACGFAIKRHNKNAQVASATNDAAEAARQKGFATTAEKNLSSCQTNMGKIVTETGISATTLGLAAAAAGGIFLLTKSGSKDGDSSGGDTTTPDDPTSVDPISTDPDSGFQTYEDMYKYWITNKCRSVLSGTISASEDIVDNCTAISKDPSFSTTLASLGTCSDVDHYGRPDCFDRINNYCLQIASEKRSGDPTCAGFCVAKPQADSCTYAVGVMTPSGTGTIQPIDQNPTTDPTSSSSGSPFNTATSGSYYPRVQQAPSGTPGYISATQTQTGLSMSPRIGVPTSGTRTLASASAGQPDCSSAQMMNKPECEDPMTKYCSQYGSQGKGCPEFCKTHKNVCKK